MKEKSDSEERWLFRGLCSREEINRLLEGIMRLWLEGEKKSKWWKRTNERSCRDRINDEKTWAEAGFLGKQEEMGFSAPSERLAWGAPTSSSSIVTGEKAENMGTDERRGPHKGRVLGSSAVSSQWNRRQGHQLRGDCSCLGVWRKPASRPRMSGAFFPYSFILDVQFIMEFYAKDIEKPSIVHHPCHYLTGSSCTLPFLDYCSHFLIGILPSPLVSLWSIEENSQKDPSKTCQMTSLLCSKPQRLPIILRT